MGDSRRKHFLQDSKLKVSDAYVWERIVHTRPRIKNVMEVVRRKEPLKSNTFMASRRDFC